DEIRVLDQVAAAIIEMNCEGAEWRECISAWTWPTVATVMLLSAMGRGRVELPTPGLSGDPLSPGHVQVTRYAVHLTSKPRHSQGGAVRCEMTQRIAVFRR